MCQRTDCLASQGGSSGSVRGKRMRKIAIALLASTSTLSLATLAAAQTTGAGQGSAPSVSEVIVTGSRIVRTGASAPTPVTVISSQQLRQAQPESIVMGLAQLPAFQGVGDRSTEVSNGGSISGNRGGFLNLRKLGTNRVLVLLDGHRLPPSTSRNEVDVSMLPDDLVQRVDVVTGGTSAVYGSDAVSGVVNYVLDRRYTGLRFDAQGGVSTHGDAPSYRIGAIGGEDFANGRAHVVGSIHYFSGKGLKRLDRPPLYENQYGWVAQDPTKPPGTATNPFIIASPVYVGQPTGTSGAFQSGPVGVINMTGAGTPFVLGAPSGTSGTLIGGGGSNSPPLPGISSLISTQRTLQGYLGLTYDFTPDLRGSLDLFGGKIHSDANAGAVPITHELVFSGNPFLPPSIQSILTSSRTPSVFFSRVNAEEIGGNPGSEDGNEFNVIGDLKGKLYKSYTFDLYASYGITHQDNRFTSVDNRHLFSALDAVTNPATGQTVCGVDLTRPSWYTGGCVPLNVFGGPGTVTPTMLNYVTGHPEYKVKNDQIDVGVNVQGNLFSTWAGAVKVSVGGEWRRQSLDQTTNSDPGVLLDFTGIRWNFASGSARDRIPFFIGSIAPAHGSVSVAEGAGEIAVPLAKDLPFAKYLEFSAAGRLASYSTSGLVKPWKLGLSDEVFDGLRIRATLSRDIRAPDLFSLFSGKQIGPSNSTFDPHCSCSAIFPAVFAIGNPNLKPEKGRTVSVGGVFQPKFLPGFSLSVDYYKIRITGAIGSPVQLDVQNACEASNGTSPQCALIIRPGPFSDHSANNAATEVDLPLQNLSFIQTSGIDTELDYRMPLDRVSDRLPGTLGLRALVNYVRNYDTQVNPTAPVLHFAGRTNFPTQVVNAISIPRVKANVSVDYENGPFTFFLQGRYISHLFITSNANQVYSPSHVPAVVYFDTTLSYKFSIAGKPTETYLTINNLFNKKPPLLPTNSGPGQYYPTILELYDVMGRYFTVGVKVHYF